MSTTKPTPEEIKTAIKVLEYFQPTADKVSEQTEQSTPEEWRQGAATWIELLGMDDPELYMQNYLDDYNGNFSENVEEE